MEIIFGIISGIVTALGMGGGTILILLLNIFTKLDTHLIQGINLMFFIPTAILTCVLNWKRQLFDFKISKKIICSGILGSIFGCVLSFKIENTNLKKYFGVFLILIAIYEIYELILQYKSENK